MRARRVGEAFLAKHTKAIDDNDVETIVNYVSLPFRRLSRTHDALIETKEQLINDLSRFRANLDALGVNFVHRSVLETRALGPRYIELRYVTHMLKDATPVVPPYEGRLVIALLNGDWKAIEMEWDMDTVGWAADFKSFPGVVSNGLIFAENDIRATGQDPMAVYQDYLDALAQTEIDDDFHAYCSYLNFPYSAHSQSLDNMISAPADVKPFFDMIKKTRNGDVSDHLERTCDKAQFLGADLLVGYHTGRAYKDGVEVIKPVNSRMILQRKGDRWKLISVANSIENKQYPFDMYAPGDALMTDIDIQKRTIKWPNSLRKRTPTA